jgi:hypothetical protein
MWLHTSGLKHCCTRVYYCPIKTLCPHFCNACAIGAIHRTFPRPQSKQCCSLVTSSSTQPWKSYHSLQISRIYLWFLKVKISQQCGTCPTNNRCFTTQSLVPTDWHQYHFIFNIWYHLFAKLTHLKIEEDGMLHNLDLQYFPSLTHLSIWGVMDYKESMTVSLVKQILSYPPLQALIMLTITRTLQHFLITTCSMTIGLSWQHAKYSYGMILCVLACYFGSWLMNV